ncbi:demethoxyubiquinone hydroxylase family protein [Paracoccus sp. M683]|uniref:demethoxyubiquinone hydroxylase family protein n=1 Tax=Paracoccus sp. M683 TaxID=2594268 RepID=UPI00117F969E|nr:demethoxyubiquinone hydroxylase family protein [Paracoccus sp. M683]TRW97565.1 demethoxyubiquinone hydroxylase family protein [Paracoccus sp. M683]
MPASDHIKIARIVRVNHAGEFSAIRIYAAQILVSSIFWKPVAAELQDLRSHEVTHCDLFRSAMPDRQSRPCRTMSLWGRGGWLLDLLTALLGPKAIWTCTEIVEDRVHHHLSAQLRYLAKRDEPLHDLIASIQAEEEGHLSLARQHVGKHSTFSRMLAAPITAAVEAVIWLSTWDGSARMNRDLSGAGA